MNQQEIARGIARDYAERRDKYPRGSAQWEYYQSLVDAAVQDIICLQNAGSPFTALYIALLLLGMFAILVFMFQ